MADPVQQCGVGGVLDSRYGRDCAAGEHVEGTVCLPEPGADLGTQEVAGGLFYRSKSSVA